MNYKLGFLLTTLTISLASSAFASGAVTESDLTGIKLPAGAYELTDDDFPGDLVEYLEDTASSLGGKCQYHELLGWDTGDEPALAEALSAELPSGFVMKDLDTGRIDADNDYQTFSLKSPKVWYAAVWMYSSKDAMLAWCNVVKK